MTKSFLRRFLGDRDDTNIRVNRNDNRGALRSCTHLVAGTEDVPERELANKVLTQTNDWVRVWNMLIK